MSDTTIVVAVLGGLAFLMAALGGYLYWRFVLRKVASATVGRDGRFDICFRASSTRRYAISLRFGVAYEGGRSHYGLVWFLEATVDGVEVLDEVISVGYDTDHVKEIPDFAQTEYFARLSRRGSVYERSATVVLAKLEPIRKGAEVCVSGRVAVAPDTRVSRLEIFLS
jgi:hypothetical protein